MFGFDATEEQRSLIDLARRFTRDRIIPIAATSDRDGKFPVPVLEEAHRLGLVNATISEEYGGVGLGRLDETLIFEELAYGCSGVQASIAANTLALTPIELGGSAEQKKTYLGWLASEPILASYATSEPSMGSDVAAMQCRATRDSGGGYVLNGMKHWITNASLASFYVVFATEDPAKKHKGIGAFIVDRSQSGVKPGRPEDKLGHRASDTASLSLEDVRIPAGRVLAAPGFGFKLAMETFNLTRPVIGTAAVGIMRRCLDECVAYAKERTSFGVPIATHQLVQAMLAEMKIRIEATTLLVRKAAWTLDRGSGDAVISSCAKAYGADAAMQTALDAVQLFGGYGYVRDYPVEKLMRDAKLLQIFEGTAQIQRLVIARQIIGK